MEFTNSVQMYVYSFRHWLDYGHVLKLIWEYYVCDSLWYVLSVHLFQIENCMHGSVGGMEVFAFISELSSLVLFISSSCEVQAVGVGSVSQLWSRPGLELSSWSRQQWLPEKAMPDCQWLHNCWQKEGRTRCGMAEAISLPAAALQALAALDSGPTVATRAAQWVRQPCAIHTTLSGSVQSVCSRCLTLTQSSSMIWRLKTNNISLPLS